MELLIGWLVLVFGTIATLIAFFGEAVEKGEDPILKRITFRGFVSMGCLSMALLLGCVKERFDYVSNQNTETALARIDSASSEAIDKLQATFDQMNRVGQNAVNNLEATNAVNDEIRKQSEFEHELRQLNHHYDRLRRRIVSNGNRLRNLIDSQSQLYRVSTNDIGREQAVKTLMVGLGLYEANMDAVNNAIKKEDAVNFRSNLGVSKTPSLDLTSISKRLKRIIASVKRNDGARQGSEFALILNDIDAIEAEFDSAESDAMEEFGAVFDNAMTDP